MLLELDQRWNRYCDYQDTSDQIENCSAHSESHKIDASTLRLLVPGFADRPALEDAYQERREVDTHNKTNSALDGDSCHANNAISRCEAHDPI